MRCQKEEEAEEEEEKEEEDEEKEEMGFHVVLLPRFFMRTSPQFLL